MILKLSINGFLQFQLLASLKGLANMKYLTKTVASKLADYAGDSELKARIRVALFETIKSDPNKPEVSLFSFS